MTSLRAAARVAVEDELVADEDPARLAGADLLPGGVVEAHDGPARRAPRGARRRAQVRGHGDGRPGDLRRAVEVVEDVAEGVHDARRQLAGQRRAAGGDHAQRARVVPAHDLRAAVEDPLQHHGDDDERRHAVLVDRPQRRLGLEAPAQDERRGEPDAEHEVRQAPGMKQRRGDERAPARTQGDLRQQRRGGGERLGLRAVGALRRAGRAAREDHDAPLRLRRHHLARVAALDELLERRVRARRRGPRPRHVAPAARGGGLDEPGELVVEDDRARVLALADAGELRRREGGVEKQRVGAELGRRHERLDEPAVVATEDRHHVALDDPLVAPGVRERVRPAVQLGERQLAVLVDDRRGVREADRRRRVAAGDRRAPAAQRLDDAREAVRARRREHAALGEPAGGERLR